MAPARCHAQSQSLCLRLFGWYKTVVMIATRFGTQPTGRFASVVAVAVAFWLLLVAPSARSATAYWGYNNLSATNPSHQCAIHDVDGFACSGYGNWDYSQDDWQSGNGKFVLGWLCQSDNYTAITGTVYGDSDPKGTYNAYYATYCGGHYNKAATCRWSGPGSYNYLQARHVP